jgi:hypothetical protein
MANVHGIR